MAIPSLLGKPGSPTIPLEPLQTEGVLQENREIGLAGFEPQDCFKPLSCEAAFYLPLRAIDGFLLAFTLSHSDSVVSRIRCDIDSLCLR